MSTFSEMAERWMLENNLATKATEATEGINRAGNVPAAQLSTDDLLEDLREPFVRWLDACCMCHPRCFGGVSCLHLDFCEWMIARNEVPCTRDIFESLLFELILDWRGAWNTARLRLDLEVGPGRP